MNGQARLRIAGAGVLALAIAVCPAQRAAMAPGTIEMDPADIPSGPQETTATAGQDLRPALHQWGVVLLPPAGDALPLPDFVHTRKVPPAPKAPRLEFSALYVHPPLKMEEPLQFDLELRFRDGAAEGWFPYADGTNRPAGANGSSSDGIRWRGVQAGVAAEGPQTTSAVWMIPRGVSTPATVKVYKPGPAGTRPDDPGTTEGDVYLFASGYLARESAGFDPAGDGVFSYRLPRKPAVAPVRAWVLRAAEAAGDPAGPAFEVQFVSTENENPGRLSMPPANGETSGSLTRDDLHGAWNEAFTGAGLSPEEASALSRMILEILETGTGESAPEKASGRGWFVALMPQAWTDDMLPLDYTGPAIQPPVRVFCVMGAL